MEPRVILWCPDTILGFEVFRASDDCSNSHVREGIWVKRVGGTSWRSRRGVSPGLVVPDYGAKVPLPVSVLAFCPIRWPGLFHLTRTCGIVAI